MGGVSYKIKDVSDPRALRVKTLKAPVGSDATSHITHRFVYLPEQRLTEVREIDNTLTKYHYSPQMRLEHIYRHTTGDVLVNHEQFSWNNEGKLLSRSFFDRHGKELISRQFVYDEKGSVKQETFKGNLTGHSDNDIYTIKRTFTPDDRNLLVEEQFPNGKTIHCTYVPETNLISSKTISDHGVPKLRHLYEYNSDLILVREIIEDLHPEANYRRINNITLVPSGSYVNMPLASPPASSLRTHDRIQDPPASEKPAPVPRAAGPGSH